MIIGGAVLSGAVLLYLYPFDAADIFDNIMHARIHGVYGGNPFHELAAEYSQDPFYTYSAWRYAPSAYGPAWELVAGLVARVAGNGIVENILAFNFLPGAFLAGTVAVVASLLRQAAPERALVGTWLIAMNPIVLYETLGNGHNDMAMAFWMVLAAWFVYKGGYTRAVAALVAGGLFKFLPVLLVPAAVWIAQRRLPPAHLLACVFWQAARSSAPGWSRWSIFPSGKGWIPWVSPAGPRCSPHRCRRSFFSCLSPVVGKAGAQTWVSRVALALTALFALWQAWKAGKEPGWTSFARSGLITLVFYLLVTCLWFQQWYPVWLVGCGSHPARRSGAGAGHLGGFCIADQAAGVWAAGLPSETAGPAEMAGAAPVSRGHDPLLASGMVGNVAETGHLWPAQTRKLGSMGITVVNKNHWGLCRRFAPAHPPHLSFFTDGRAGPNDPKTRSSGSASFG